MEVTLKAIEEPARAILENLYTYYVYEFSQFMPWELDSSGQYPFNRSSLDSYWQKPGYSPYFIYADGSLAGFVLLRPYPGAPQVNDIEQFFVLRRFKGKGVGKRAFATLVERHPGPWQIRVLKENHGALNFWRSAVAAVADGDFDERLDVDGDLEMVFLRFDKPA
ncbi:GNAT family N-acetyltransferase [Halioxenophilus sp. WMMB6]|uniref:GNAT family N-acetyltransferase n=1 Tax=Halioxenophilus sp. WMMB6 TaxID=3073815 RepID=UPI00295EE6CC|nr:GNAT family N-acetyltransferase [Halioxenophilus sp. WMMB6]